MLTMLNFDLILELFHQLDLIIFDQILFLRTIFNFLICKKLLKAD